MKGGSLRISKSFLAISSVFFLLILNPPLCQAGQFKITRVYNGDTVQAAGHDITIKIVLVAIDAPEISHGKRNPGQPYAQRARKYLANLILNKTVDVKGYGLDPYNRILGVITLDDRDINLEMIKAGLAEVYRGLAPFRFNLDPYWKAEREARIAKKGMWSLGDKYVSPKDWRMMNKDVN